MSILVEGDGDADIFRVLVDIRIILIKYLSSVRHRKWFASILYFKQTPGASYDRCKYYRSNVVIDWRNAPYVI